MRHSFRLRVEARCKASLHKFNLFNFGDIKEKWEAFERLGLSQEVRASHRKARSLTGRPGLSQGGQASHRKAGPPTGRLGPSQGGQAIYREARELTGK